MLTQEEQEWENRNWPPLKSIGPKFAKEQFKCPGEHRWSDNDVHHVTQEDIDRLDEEYYVDRMSQDYYSNENTIVGVMVKRAGRHQEPIGSDNQYCRDRNHPQGLNHWYITGFVRRNGRTDWK